MWSMFSNIPSIEWNFFRSSIAVLEPTPGTPGIESDLSPYNALISATDSGPRPPYLFLTISMS